MSKRILSIKKVIEATGLSRATLYRYIQQGDFPGQVQLGPGRVGWREDDVNAWVDSRPAARRAS